MCVFEIINLNYLYFQGNRDENPSVDDNQAKKDAQDLKAAGKLLLL